tara:strand:+ start:254 stop:424 length:171 start_codon:yes stop_codon:yes gene_type:complete
MFGPNSTDWLKKGKIIMAVSVLLEGQLIEGARDGFTALLAEKFKLTKSFDGFQTID